MPSSTFHLTADELFESVRALADALPADRQQLAPARLNRQLHELLVQTCHEGTRTSGQAFGNLFSQVDYLCRRCHIAVPDRMAIQTMRRHSNRSQQLSAEDLRYDLRAMALFISAVFSVPIPHQVVTVIPPTNRPHSRAEAIDYRYIRCMVHSWDENTIIAQTEQSGADNIVIDYSAEHLRYLKDILHEGMQLNLIDCTAGMKPALVIVEPDYLIDISAIAACFEPFGHHPLSYIMKRMSPSATSQPILLGNLAGQILDDTINNQPNLNASIRKNFRQKALDFSACPGFSPSEFLRDADNQAQNIRQAVDVLFDANSRDSRATRPSPSRDKAILEPSFVCEHLGIQGRVDLMTTDLSLLVEQKSGKNFRIERHQPGAHGSLMLENHYVQLLLYYGVLRQNFSLSFDAVDMRLLYSRFPAKDGLVVVNYLQQLFREAIQLRNLIVAWELHIARHGFESVLPLLKPDTFVTDPSGKSFFDRWKRQEVQQFCSVLQQLSPLEHDYFCQMVTFVFREQRVSRLGSQEGVTSAANDLWNMPLDEKLETGNILMDLTISDMQKSAADGGYDLITLTSAASSADGDGLRSLPNFRSGDPIYLYHYDEGHEPDLRRSILLKGALVSMQSDSVVVGLNDGQQNPHVFAEGTYAIEHAPTDTSGSSLRALYQFACAPKSMRDLLLAQRPPTSTASSTTQLPSPTIHSLSPITQRALCANDYFLLVGPPGTGKTSMALRELVIAHLNAYHQPTTTHHPSSTTQNPILLTAYTNRAVDEICAMLQDAQLDFVRLGSMFRCDPRFHKNLVENYVGENPRLDMLRQMLQEARIVVATTSTLQGNPQIFSLKKFCVAIVDEASQILEPDILGILTRVPKFILIGDHKQLPAVVQQSDDDSRVDLPSLQAIQLSNCRNSLFERLLRIERAAGRTEFIGVLNRQGRMHPDIAAFPSHTFYAREHLVPVPLPHQTEPTTTPRMVFIPVNDHLSPSSTTHSPATTTRSNQAEASIVAEQLWQVYQETGEHFSPQKTVGVIVPYRNQIALIRQETEKLLTSHGQTIDHHPLLDVSVDTVERYQGSQRDVIIYSFTVSQPFQLEFLTASTFTDDDGTLVDRKLNVALTRARRKLILTGNPQLLRRVPLFRQLLDHIASQTVD